MKNYADRLAEANEIYAAGLRKVKTTPAPEGQKFPAGSFVRIADDLGPSMFHFKGGVFARVEYTYDHAYGGGDKKSYSLLIEGAPGRWHSVAWYWEHQLTAVTDEATIAALTASIEKEEGK